jgi:cytochrome c oxidase subunit 3
MERTKAFSVLDIAKFRMYLMMTFLLGVLFCLSQWTVWSDLNSRGLAIHQGIFPSILHGFTYVHIAHIVIAFIGILWPLKIKSIRVWKEESNQVLLENITKCWHFLGIIWLIMYLALFVF